MEKENSQSVKFNPELFTIALKLGAIYIQRGINKFDDWKQKLIEGAGEKITIWLPAIWTTLYNYPANTKFNAPQITATAKYIGALMDEGKISSFAEALTEFEKTVGKENVEKFEPMFKAVYLGISKFFEDNFDLLSNSQVKNPAELQRGAIALQLTLDEEIVVGNIPLNGMPIPGTDKIIYEGDYHIMHVSLVRYQDRRYISISRMHYRKLKKTGEIRKTFRNSIWIPISRVRDVIELLRRAESESDRRHWEDYYINEDLTVSAEILDEGETKKRILTNVRETARAFLISSANYLENKLTLKVSVKSVAEQMNLSLPLVLRVIDYLEDAGYIKQVEKFNNDSKDKLFEYMPKIFELIPNEDIENAAFEKARKTSGLSREDIDALDYLDDEDPKISRWAFARRFAETDIINELIVGEIPVSFKITAAGYDWIE